MFDLYMYPQWPTPFPRAYLGTFIDIKDLVTHHEFTGKEVSDMLDGNVVREKYCLELSPKILRKLMIEDTAKENPEGITEREIAEMLGETENAVQKRLSKALKKLRTDEVRTLLYSAIDTKRKNNTGKVVLC